MLLADSTAAGSVEADNRSVPVLFVSSFFLQFGLSLSAAFIPLYAMELGADVIQIGMIVSAQSVGSMLYNLPGGFLVARKRARPLMMVGMMGGIAATLVFGFGRSVETLMAAAMILGISMSQFNLTRLTYIRQNISQNSRGRVLSRLGGLFRLSRISGPVIGGLVINGFGFRAVFFLHTLVIFTSALVVLLRLPPGRDVEYTNHRQGMRSLTAHLRGNSRNMIPILIGIGGLSIIRVSRRIIFPLWADRIGISVTTLGVIMGIAAAAELIPVIPVGWILDKKGRKWALIPSMIVMVGALSMIPLVTALFGYAAVVILFGIGNGFGSGISMTLATDLAPRKAVAQFLGIWRFVNDGAAAIGPLLVGFVSRSMSMAWSPWIIAAVGGATIIVILEYKDQYLLSVKRNDP